MPGRAKIVTTTSMLSLLFSSTPGAFLIGSMMTRSMNVRVAPTKLGEGGDILLGALISAFSAIVALYFRGPSGPGGG